MRGEGARLPLIGLGQTRSHRASCGSFWFSAYYAWKGSNKSSVFLDDPIRGEIRAARVIVVGHIAARMKAGYARG